MKFKFMMLQEEKNKLVRKTILRLSKALYNACIQAYEENNCQGCKFKMPIGCSLYGRPIEWSNKFK